MRRTLLSSATFVLAFASMTSSCTRLVDFDEDGVLDDVDNCPRDVNASQLDRDADGIGDVCDAIDDGIVGDGDGDGDRDGVGDGDVEACNGSCTKVLMQPAGECQSKQGFSSTSHATSGRAFVVLRRWEIAWGDGCQRRCIA